jgi:hypothetical protein
VGLAIALAAIAGAGACTAIAGIGDYAVGAGGAGDGTPTATSTGGTGCVPTTCEKVGAVCGTVPDGCGGTVVCAGKCAAPETCGGAGVANQCGCTKVDCASQGKNCGTIDDHCGGTLSCGASCPAGETCGANGHPNVCGKGTCTPKTCAEQGIECGSAPQGNGCDGPLECPACQGGLACIGSKCQCPPTWSTTLAGEALSGRPIAENAGVIAVGTESATKQAYAVRLDDCTGAVTLQRSWAPSSGGDTAVSAELHDVVSSVGGLLAVGTAATASDPGHGLYLELDRASFASSSESFLFGSAGVDSIASVAEASDGSLWMAGTVNDQGQTVGWLVKSQAHAALACGVAGPPTSGPGASMVLVPQAAAPVRGVYRDLSGQVVVAGWNEATCAPPAQCGNGDGCAPANSVALVVDDQHPPSQIALFSAVHADAVLYVAGAYCPAASPNDCYGFVRAVDVATGTVHAERFDYDAGPAAEAILGLAVDGDSLFVVGTAGLDLGAGQLGSGHAVVARLDRASLKASFTSALPAMNVGVGVVSDGPSTIIVTGRTDTGSVVVRCSKALCN